MEPKVVGELETKNGDKVEIIKADYWLAEQIALNQKAEAEAIEKYMSLLGRLDPVRHAKIIASIREIVADEKNHQIILQEIQACLDGAIMPEQDGLKGAAKKIGIEKGDKESRAFRRMADDSFGRRGSDND